jgi:hypothetical protein
LTDLFGLDAYSDCVQQCDDQDRERKRSVDKCAKLGVVVGAGTGVAIGGFFGAKGGSAISGGLIGGALGAVFWGSVVELGGRLGSTAAWHFCVNHCADSYLPQPTWPSTWPDAF